MIAEIQCLPSPIGRPDDTYAHVDAAIAMVRASGLRYEVGPLGTSFEGDPGDVWTTLRAAHEACLAAGATSIVTVIKVYEGGAAIDDLVTKHRR